MTAEIDLGLRKKADYAKKTGKPRNKFKNGYSVDLAIMRAYMSFYENLIRLAFPSGRRRRRCQWDQESYQSRLSHWLQQWTKHHRKILNELTPLSKASKLLAPAHVQYLSFHELSLHHVSRQLKDIKHMLHGSKRAEMRTNQNDELRHREELRKKKQLGTLIELLTYDPKRDLDLQTLPCPTRGQVVDHYENQRTLNKYFHDWHAIPPDLDPAAHHLAHKPLWWTTLLQYDAEDDANKPLHPDSSIPTALQDGLRKVCAKKVSIEVQNTVEDAIYADITYEQFNEALKHIKTDSAPGPSNATANMIKAWPEETRAFVYRHMVNIWKSRTIPSWFKDKILKLAPKVSGNSSLENMRPISLYEIVRKVWTTIVAKRINHVWHTEGILHRAQYGYQLDNGVQMALFNTMNEVEGAYKRQQRKYITFWDIRRAFDSIPRNLQRLAWMRLGVPEDVSDWFVNLDNEGSTFIATPLYDQNKKLSTPEEMLKGAPHVATLRDDNTSESDLAFHPERGIGQGESASSLMWTALYDILLEWIDPANRQLHAAENLTYSDEDVRNTKMNAYADDLCTITSGQRAGMMQQLQATWLSAFCAFTGLVMHPKKIKPTIVGPIPTFFLPHIRVYDHGWNAIDCPMLPELESYK